MTGTFRCLLVAISLMVIYWILHRIRKLKVRMENAIFWIVLSLILLIFAVFPQVAYFLSSAIGIRTPANFIFISVIFILLLKLFTLSMTVSHLEEKVSILTAEIAIRSHSEEKRIECLENVLEEEKNDK